VRRFLLFILPLLFLTSCAAAYAQEATGGWARDEANYFNAVNEHPMAIDGDLQTEQLFAYLYVTPAPPRLALLQHAARQLQVTCVMSAPTVACDSGIASLDWHLSEAVQRFGSYPPDYAGNPRASLMRPQPSPTLFPTPRPTLSPVEAVDPDITNEEAFTELRVQVEVLNRRTLDEASQIALERILDLIDTALADKTAIHNLQWRGRWQDNWNFVADNTDSSLKEGAQECIFAVQGRSLVEVATCSRHIEQYLAGE
jgi:hypothetical protein